MTFWNSTVKVLVPYTEIGDDPSALERITSEMFSSNFANIVDRIRMHSH